MAVRGAGGKRIETEKSRRECSGRVRPIGARENRALLCWGCNWSAMDGGGRIHWKVQIRGLAPVLQLEPARQSKSLRHVVVQL